MPVGLPRRPKRRPPPTAGRQRAQAKGVTRVSTLPQSAHRTGCRPRCRSRVTAATTQRAVSRAPVVPPGGAVAYKGGQPRLNRTRLHRGASPFHQPGRPLDVAYTAYGAVGLVSSGDRRRAQSAAVRGHVGKASRSMGATVGWAFAGCAQCALAAPVAAPPPSCYAQLAAAATDRFRSAAFLLFPLVGQHPPLRQIPVPPAHTGSVTAPLS